MAITPKAGAGSTDNKSMRALPLTFTPDNGAIKGKVNPCVERFLQHCHRRKYPKKSVIIYAGDQPDVLYYIISGSVKKGNLYDSARLDPAWQRMLAQGSSDHVHSTFRQTAEIPRFQDGFIGLLATCGSCQAG